MFKTRLGCYNYFVITKNLKFSNKSEKKKKTGSHMALICADYRNYLSTQVNSGDNFQTNSAGVIHDTTGVVFYH